MEEKDLSKIPLVSLDIYFGKVSNKSFYNAFGRFGIRYVSQVLDDNLMKECLNHIRKSSIRNELMGYVDLVKNKYLGTPLTADMYLEQEFFDKETASRMGFDSVQINGIFEFADRFQMTDNMKVHIKVIDFLKILSKYNKEHEIFDGWLKLLGTGSIIETYIDSYEKKRAAIIGNIGEEAMNEMLTILSEELNTLVIMRNDLNTQIDELENKIEYLYNIRNGVRK